MARTKQNQRSANRANVPMGATGGRPPPSKMTMALLATSVVSALWAAAMLLPAGRIAYYYLFLYSEYYLGVVTLVSLSVTVMLGVVATDRLILSIRQRVLMQSAHRAVGTIAVASLVGHLVTKVSNHKMNLIDIFIPFLNNFYIGLGTIAGFTMTSVLWTGFIRARFVGRGKPWMWRSVHSIAYLSWPIAIVHGLNAGRAAKTFVYVGYILCVVFVLLYLAVRFSVSLNRKKDFSSTATGSMKPVGSMVPTSSPKMGDRSKRRSGGGDPMGGRVVADRSNAPVAVLDAWVPAAGGGSAAPVSAGPAAPVSARPAAPVSAMPTSAMPTSAMPSSAMPVSARPASGPAAPVSSRPYDDSAYRGSDGRSRRYLDDEPPSRGRRDRDDRYEDERYDDAPRSRARRYAEDEEPIAPRARRYAEDERFDESTRPVSRRALEEGARRYAEADEPPAPRSRRPVEDDRYDEAPRSRARRYAEDEEEIAPRARRYADDDRSAPRGRRFADEDTRGRSRFAEDDVPQPRAPRYDGDREDSGRHSRADFIEPADPWRASDRDYPAPDETPTLVDMASRRARRAVPDTSRAARRKGGRGVDETADDMYWRQLRGEAN